MIQADSAARFVSMLVISAAYGRAASHPGLRLGDARRRDQLLCLGDLLDRRRLSGCVRAVREGLLPWPVCYLFFGAGLRT
jgi:hypothetical protein